ncbi:hypothetical protein PFISCL1PPCAC_16886, partial [Pristionchus fissidentatus]
ILIGFAFLFFAYQSTFKGNQSTRTIHATKFSSMHQDLLSGRRQLILPEITKDLFNQTELSTLMCHSSRLIVVKTVMDALEIICQDSSKLSVVYLDELHIFTTSELAKKCSVNEIIVDKERGTPFPWLTTSLVSGDSLFFL